MRINADKSNAINFSLGYTSEMEYKVGVKKNTLTATIKNEMKYASLPAAVSINEAVELTRKYDEPETAKFVNGILGSFLRQEVKE